MKRKGEKKGLHPLVLKGNQGRTSKVVCRGHARGMGGRRGCGSACQTPGASAKPTTQNLVEEKKEQRGYGGLTERNDSRHAKALPPARRSDQARTHFPGQVNET